MSVDVNDLVGNDLHYKATAGGAAPVLLRRLIGVQGALLGWTLYRQAGVEVFNEVERLRAIAKELAGLPAGPQRRAILQAQVDALAAMPTEALAPIVRAYCEYFLVINPAEEAFGQHQRQRVSSHLEEHLADLTMRYGRQAVARALAQVRLIITLTAHPTEVRRPPVICHQSALRRVLLELLRSGALDDEALSPENQDPLAWQVAVDNLPFESDWATAALVAQQPEAIRALLRQAASKVEALWAIDPYPARRPTVLEEIDYYHSYLPDVLCDATVRVARHLSDTAERLGLPLDEPLRPIAWGLWPGGDRDGHSGVTWETTRAERRQVGALIVERFYLPRLRALAGDLAAESAASGEGEQLLATYRERYTSVGTDTDIGPFAHLVRLISHRLSETPYGSAAYNNSRQLEDDLRTLAAWLHESHLPLHAEQVTDLADAVHLFGFIMAPLDIRQHASVIRRVVAELLPAYAALESDDDQGPASMDQSREEERLRLLESVLAQPRHEGLPLNQSPEMNELLRTLGTVGWAAAILTGPAVRSIIISGAERASDVLAVLYLLERTGYRPAVGHGVYLVPLFETVEDIEAAPTNFTRLLASHAFRQYVGGGLVEIMLGYSDSMKTGGLLRARWVLQQAQEQLWEVAQRENVRLRIFHGRGGTISRGGGGTPAQKIAAQPPTGPAMRVTYQGEEVARWFGSQDSAVEILESSLAALLDKQFETDEVRATWREALEEISTAAMDAYRVLLAQPDFLDVFLRAVPIGLVEEIGVGSRPPRRGATSSIYDLRAIPWVWSWSVMRSGMTSWCGVGSGLAAFAARHGESGRQALREAYTQWPFFQRLIDDIHVAVLQADSDIAALHAQSKADEAVFTTLEAEYELTKRELSFIITAPGSLAGTGQVDRDDQPDGTNPLDVNGGPASGGPTGIARGRSGPSSAALADTNSNGSGADLFRSLALACALSAGAEPAPPGTSRPRQYARCCAPQEALPGRPGSRAACLR